MEIEPRHVFFLLFLSITLMLLGGIGDGVLSSPDANVTSQTAFERLEHGDIAAKIGALWDIFNLNYDWLTPWLQWPFRILNWAFLVLIARQLWKLVPIVGR